MGMYLESLFDGLFLGLCGLSLLREQRIRWRDGLPLLFGAVLSLLLRQSCWTAAPEECLLLPLDNPIQGLFLLLGILLLNSLYTHRQEGAVFFGTCAQFALYLLLRETSIALFGLLEWDSGAGFLWGVRLLSLLLWSVLALSGLTRWLREQLEEGDIPLRLVACDTLCLLLALWYFLPRFSEPMQLSAAAVLTALLILFDGAVLLWEQRRLQEGRQARLLEQYLPMVEELVGSVRARQHTFNHQLMAIQAALDGSTTLEEARTAAGELIGGMALPETDRALLCCDSKVLSGMLFGKLSQAQERKLRMDIRLKGSFLHRALSEADWVELVGSLLDNAMEASSAGDAIFVEAAEEGSLLRFTVSNPCPPRSNTELAMMFRRGYSTKGGSNRGYGLYNVRCLVERHHGKLLMKTAERGGQSYLTIGVLVP